MPSAYKTLSASTSKGSANTSSTANLSTTNGTSSSSTPKAPRQRVLILSSRGVTYRHRHLLNDIYTLLPHSRKDAKLDTKTKLYQLNELAELYNCNNVLFFEARKGKDLYVWMSKAPNGPTVKMHLQNLHTTSELHFPGNCLKGSRPLLSFDSTFTSTPALLLIKDLLAQIFGVPPNARKIKPFVDHLMGFTFADGKVWIRCFEIRESDVSKAEARKEDTDNNSKTTAGGGEEEKKSKKKKKEKEKTTPRDQTELSLVEIGPRFVLTPIVILEGSFGGPVVYENKEFVSPNQVRRDLRMSKAGRHRARNEQDVEDKGRRGDLGLRTGVGKRERGELEERVLFA
ncbi:MAG: Ribosome biogenesis protein brx1 [Ramalina farinacea]|uniref:Ribosome biogenesis protein brx1 n=1 Tax=Ramalina farinacea TaxID=258253 RepID=A0AA43QNJ6_9LECA|nr:Ribosome biogenesis protein brx1 [Ramalina farinacea]